MTRAARISLLLAVAIAAPAVLACGDVAPKGDPLAEAIRSGSTYLRTSRDSTDLWTQVRDASAPAYARAQRALDEHHPLLALQRLSSAQVNLAAWQYASSHPEAFRDDTTGLAARWLREGDSLQAYLGRPARAARGRVRGLPDPRERLASFHPAAIRALAETALPDVRIYYDTVLDYASSTQPVFGYFYIGVARNRRDFFELCATLSQESAPPEPPFRSIAPELDTLEAHVLAAYRPPASLDRHSEFIGVSAAIKQARELDAEGFPRGALLQYLGAAQRFAAMRDPAPLDSAALAARLAGFAARIAGDHLDHSIATLYLDAARSDLAGMKAGEVPPGAIRIATDVLPLYFAALEPAPPVVARPAPEATVTLVRWPYT